MVSLSPIPNFVTTLSSARFIFVRVGQYFLSFFGKNSRDKLSFRKRETCFTVAIFLIINKFHKFEKSLFSHQQDSALDKRIFVTLLIATLIRSLFTSLMRFFAFLVSLRPLESFTKVIFDFFQTKITKFEWSSCRMSTAYKSPLLWKVHSFTQGEQVRGALSTSFDSRLKL